MAAAAELSKLNRRRGSKQSQLTLLAKFLQQFNKENPTATEIESLKQRLETILPVLDTFNDIQLEIEMLEVEGDEERNLEIVETFQNLYFSLVAECKTILAKHAPAGTDHSQSYDTVNENVKSETTLPSKLSNIKLPTIELPKFTGALAQWREFCDAFGGLIHKSDELTDGQKLFYLRASLKGEPADMINSLETTDLNYSVAWESLRKRYDNKRRIIQTHVQALLNLEPIGKDSQAGLRQFINSIETNMQCLEAMHQPTKQWDALIVQIILNKLDFFTTREWEARLNSRVDSNNIEVTFEELMSFLNSKLNTLEAITTKRPAFENKFKSGKPPSTRAYTATISTNCPKCQENHTIQNCKKFSDLSHNDKFALVKNLKLCINCLRSGHSIAQCRSSNCRTCHKKHHTTLHIPSKHDSISTDKTNSSNNEKPSDTPSNTTLVSYTTNVSQVLLPTAQVQTIDGNGKSHTLRVLLDSGSQSNFITVRACQNLGLKHESVDVAVTGINPGSYSVKAKTQIKIGSLHNKYSVTLDCYVLPQITIRLPSQDVNIFDFNIPAHLTLADPTFNKAAEIDMLIGAGLFYDLLCIGQIRNSGVPTLQNTKFGWIISGSIKANNANQTVSCLSRELNSLHSDLQMFWKIDDFDDSQSMTADEEHVESFFIQTTKRTPDGRFIVRIPFKANLENLGDSFSIAKTRFISLENKFTRHESLKSEYANFIHEYENLGHMQVINEKEPAKVAFYLPHHPVIKADSETTKLRVVFDGSCKPNIGLSVNETQYVGPIIQNDLYNIVTKFRMHEFAITADIAKMYRQVLIHPDDRKYQRILWRDDAHSELKTYELATVTYGLTSSSFLAIRCIFQLAIENEDSYPHESKILKEQFYVDDLLSGSDSIENLRKIQGNLCAILQQGGFTLRKWKSNVPEINEHATSNSISLNGQNNKTLGILWNPVLDSFTYSINNLKMFSRTTKRTILATTAQLFDPLGFLAPVIIIPKLIIQQIWQLNLDWDDALPLNIHNEWNNFKVELKHINDIVIPRFALISGFTTVEIIGFSDASERGYGACIYVKSTNAQGICSIKLLSAKSRVAPLKCVSLPRLELLAAVVLAQLVHKLKNTLSMRWERESYWVDSQIVLAWINAPSNRWTTFVANRVALIQRLTSADSWKHVKSCDNPADLISRGCLPKNLLKSELWWEGPSWLKLNNDEWPHSEAVQYESVPEMRKINKLSVFTTTQITFPFERFSSFQKLVRTTAYCLRFTANCMSSKTIRNHKPLDKDELDRALLKLVKIAQIEAFNDEHAVLDRGKPINKTSKILRLTPFLDKTGIIRVGGRLQLSEFSYDKKHPILLPAKHPLTRLLFEQKHRELLHAGPNLLLSSVRERFWPISGRNIARGIVRKCIRCYRYNAKPINPLMGDLPSHRVKSLPPFHCVGVDYAGPMLIKNKLGRGASTSKCYICIFICFAIKAVHLEPVTALSTDAFIAAFRRFVSRRGKPLHVYSDNGKNFVGANAELKTLAEFLNKHENSIVEQIANRDVNWHFIPAHSPHFGGLWEAGVKSVKHHLKRVMHTAALTFEELYTVLTQIESVLNSRPLTPLSADPNDLDVLTPAHFLIGRTFMAAPDEDVRDLKQGRLSRFQYSQQIIQHFWARWSLEYISELQQRAKWKESVQSLQLNDMVLIKDDNAPPSKWRIGRIQQLHPGKDGVPRVVTVKCANGYMKRSFSKLCVLPIEN